MLRKATNSAPYTFITLNKNTLTPIEKICKDTIGYNFVVLGNNVLFLEKSGVKDTNRFFVPTQLTKPANTVSTGTISSFNILNLEANLPDTIFINVVWGDQSLKASYTYILTFDPTRTGAVAVANNLIGQTFTDASHFLVGNRYYIYSSSKKKIIFYNSNWADYSASPITYPTDGLNFKVFRLYSGSLIIDFFESQTSSKLYFIGVNQITEITWTSTTTTAYVDYSDGVSNLLRIGSDNTLWATLSRTAQTLQTTEIPTTELISAGDEVQDIALSGNVATIFFSTKIRYLIHTGSGKVDQLFDKTVASTDIDYQEANYEINIKFSCICASLKKFACFSSTLNCLIVKKGGATCSSEGNYAPIDVSG